MVQIIAGDKGKGKTKYLLDKANDSMATAHGAIAYLDKSTKHMFELDRKIRLINVFDYPIQNMDSFVGFICGIISQDHDLEIMYLDSFLKLTNVDDSQLETAVRELDNISAHYNVDFVLSVSMDKSRMSEFVQEKVIVSL